MFKKIPPEISNKIKKFQKYEKNNWKKYKIRKKVIHEELIKEVKKDIIGISYFKDIKTQNIINSLNFTDAEMTNLFKYMEFFGNNLDILKITKIKEFSFDLRPNYDCAIIEVNKNGKFFIDFNNNISKSLNDENYNSKYIFIEI